MNRKHSLHPKKPTYQKLVDHVASLLRRINLQEITIKYIRDQGIEMKLLIDRNDIQLVQHLYYEFEVGGKIKRTVLVNKVCKHRGDGVEAMDFYDSIELKG